MRMITALMKEIEIIERIDTWAYEFILAMKAMKENDPKKKLSGHQFRRLQKLYNTYCEGAG